MQKDEESKSDKCKDRSLDKLYELLKKLEERAIDAQAVNTLMFLNIIELLIHEGVLDRSQVSSHLDLHSKAGLQSDLGDYGNYLLDSLRLMIQNRSPGSDKTEN